MMAHTDEELENRLRALGQAMAPDRARLRALLAPKAVPSPFIRQFTVRAVGSVMLLALVLLGSGAWFTTTTPALLSVTPEDEVVAFQVALEDDLGGDMEALALLDSAIDSALQSEDDVLSEEFLDSTFF